MSNVVYRPRSVPEIVDASVQLFRRTYRELVAIMAIGYVPWIAASTVLSRARDTAALGDPRSMLDDVSGLLLLFVGGVWFAVVSAGCVAAASDAYLGDAPDIRRSLKRAFARAWPIVATSIITWTLTVLGAILLVWPGLYLFSRYAMSSTVALLENRPTIPALQRAAALSRERKLHIFGAIALAWTIYLVIALTVGGLVGLLGMFWLSPLAEAVISIGVAPLIAVVSTVLYYDLRIRNEGLDVELMERQLSDPTEPVRLTGDRQF